MEFTEQRDLRGGRPCWTDSSASEVPTDRLPEGQVDVAIIGAGIIGAAVGERLSQGGRSVALLDRRFPAAGSTAASTALVLWAADVPLTQLASQIGERDAIRAWRKVHRTVRDFADYLDANNIDCARVERPEVYLCGTLLDESALKAEAALRQKAGLPSRFVEADDVAERFGIVPRAAIVSDGAYELDPVQLTLQLLRRARDAGATVTFPREVSGISSEPRGLVVELADGASLAAKTVIIATGYERALWHLPPAFSVSSSYAIATAPGAPPLWRENAMIWEASTPYLYVRMTADGRIIAGGADEETDDAVQRDRLLDAKAGELAAGLRGLVGSDVFTVDCAWAAAFGSSPDGLPAIGPSHLDDRIRLCSGFGGNGVTFAALAADLASASPDDAASGVASLFDPYRFRTKTP